MWSSLKLDSYIRSRAFPSSVTVQVWLWTLRWGGAYLPSPFSSLPLAIWVWRYPPPPLSHPDPASGSLTSWCVRSKKREIKGTCVTGHGSPFAVGWPTSHGGFLGGSVVKNSTALQETWVRKISWRREWQPHSNILSWRSPWTEEPGGLQPTGLHKSQRQRNNNNDDCAWTLSAWRCPSDNHSKLTTFGGWF